MASEGRSLQDRIRERQQSGFVGRQGPAIQYRENFAFFVDDERRRFLFNIHGDAGVGKTFLTTQFRGIAAGSGALTAYIDETVEDVTSAMSAIAEQFSRAGSRLGDFEKRAADYQQRRHELESDPNAPAGVAAFLTKTAVTIGLAAARDIPVAGSLLAPIEGATVADQANQAREYLARKFRDHRDVRLLLSPADELTPVFVAGLSRVATNRPVALFLDTYERTGLVLDQWLRSLYAGRYGDLPETIVTTISGQKPLNPNLWGQYLPVIADIPLEPFSEVEARQFLASKDITDETTIEVILTLSGRLPLWLATLAEVRLQGNVAIGDPSGDAVDRFLKWENDPTRRTIAVAAALPRILNQDVLAVIAPTGKARELFDWLRGLPFVSQRGQAWTYHDVVRGAMLRLRRAETPTTGPSAAAARPTGRWSGMTMRWLISTAPSNSTPATMTTPLCAPRPTGCEARPKVPYLRGEHLDPTGTVLPTARLSRDERHHRPGERQGGQSSGAGHGATRCLPGARTLGRLSNESSVLGTGAGCARARSPSTRLLVDSVDSSDFRVAQKRDPEHVVTGL